MQARALMASRGRELAPPNAMEIEADPISSGGPQGKISLPCTFPSVAGSAEGLQVDNLSAPPLFN